MSLKPVRLAVVLSTLTVMFASATAFGQSSTTPEGNAQLGKVKSWDSIHGWGYVTVDGEDIVVDLVTVERAGIGRLVKGQTVRVKLRPDRRGRRTVGEIQIVQ
jgi:cold shock CspA family protein